MNNVTLPPERGYPFQLVAESKWGYKWIKWITSIELSDNREYLGYWERQGYSNYGGIEEAFFGQDPDYGIWLTQVAQAETIPEFPSWIILPLFVIATLAVIMYRKRLPKRMCTGSD